MNRRTTARSPRARPTILSDETVETGLRLGIGVALLAALCGLAVIATGCGAAAYRSCDVDSDCRTDEICAGDRCAKKCSNNDDCELAGEICRPYVDPEREDDVNVCLPPTDASDEPEAGHRCESDDDCQGLDAGPAVCGLNGRCVIVERRRAVRIVDRSSPASDGGDGAEIAAVYLLDSDGDEVVGFGETLEYCPAGGSCPDGAATADTGTTGDSDSAGSGTDASPTDASTMDASTMDASTTDSSGMDSSGMDSSGMAMDSTAMDAGTSDGSGIDADPDSGGARTPPRRSTIDGEKPNLNGDRSCIRDDQTRTTPLGGEAGQLLVRFVDAQGEPIAIDESHEIGVVEWGTNCEAGDPETGDAYDVYLCTTTQEHFPEVGDSGCSALTMQPTSGAREFDVELSDSTRN